MKWVLAALAIGAGLVLAREFPSIVRYAKIAMM
jgi:hypothetical protein